MAAVLRFSPPPLFSPKPQHLPRLPRAAAFKSPGAARAEDLVRLLPRKENMAVFSTSFSKFQCSTSADINFVGIFQKVRIKWAHGFCHCMLECASDHQRISPFSFMKTFLLVNSLVLVLPLKVLAETCEPENSFFSMPLLFIIALIGATVGGLLARQRRGELKRLNDQLRQINAALRRQAKIESYAPNLSYAPVGRVQEAEVIVDPRKEQLINNLRTGKNYLRNQDPENAFAEFKSAFELAQSLGDHVEEKKAARGLGASLQRQGKYKEAIKYHSRVLEISNKVGEDSGNTEAYGAIADCYTELGDLERAGKFYDKYIARLQND